VANAPHAQTKRTKSIKRKRLKIASGVMALYRPRHLKERAILF
jgi:hypothetical protein